MASDLFQADSVPVAGSRAGAEAFSIGQALRKFLTPLASLKLTVALFAMAIFIIFAGTLAQVNKDIWQVIDVYFRTTVAWIELQIFFPPAFFPSKPVVPGGFYFPGGWLIGAMMALNLIAAHGLRFRFQASGTPLKLSLAMIGLGLVMTWLVIASGSNDEGLQQAPWIEWSTLWQLLRFGLMACWIGVLFAYPKIDRHRTTERCLVLITACLLGALVVWLMYQGDAARLSDSSLRILWQLLKGISAGFVLLAGCVMAFKKRAGVVLLHTGIGLMMLNELLVGLSAVEGQMYIPEGETVNYLQDVRSVELAIVDRSDPIYDDVFAVPQSLLLRGRKIQQAELPFDVKIVRFMKNSSVPRELKSDEKSPANRGAGLRLTVDELKPGSGTDMGDKVDVATLYVTFRQKDDGQQDDDQSLGTYLLSQHLRDQQVTVGEKTYEVNLRHKRYYKPYTMQLIDVRKDDYLGTSTPRNYSSELHLVDDTRNVNRTVKIWMNNPLRFAGETFYQSGYHQAGPGGAEATTLAVVTNTGWMIPYVACMIVATGLMTHFSIVLLRFLNRRSRIDLPGPTGPEKVPSSTTGRITGKTIGHDRSRRRQTRPGSELEPRSATGVKPWVLPLAILVALGGWLAGKARTPNEPGERFHFHEFGQLPLVYQGRVKPYDTLARNSLRIISGKQTYLDESDKEQPAIRWLLDVISSSGEAEKHQVFRIENLELQDTLGLERRPGFYRYSVEEFRGRIQEFEEQARLAHSKAADDLSVYQRKVLELDNKIRTFTLLVEAFRHPELPTIPTEEEFNADHDLAVKKMQAFRRVLVEFPQRLMAMHPPLAVPVTQRQSKDARLWEPYSVAWIQGYVQSTILQKSPDPATASINAMLMAYAAKDAPTFNHEVAKFRRIIERDSFADVDIAKVNFEAFFNNFQPFYHAAVLYVLAFLLAALGWLGWTGPLNRAAFWVIVLTLAVHTFAMISRIYISGRPPVTNLYSSAVFIGWGCVALGLILEMVYRMGIGNILAAVSGFATLLIAHNLAGDGDTFTVLQAVLDTQFWLATHVTCITLGYSTTFLSGALGVLYILRGTLTPSLSPQVGKELSRMIYGTLCFAIFFSFVGTVLGGLWADDSWGRFWGWDPKENGALIIVLWNALVLHARWDGMAKERGLAVLAVFGNIATSWSWFGVNELGVGLHSYGFTEGVLRSLGIFIAINLAIVALGVLPKQMWWSYKRSVD